MAHCRSGTNVPFGSLPRRIFQRETARLRSFGAKFLVQKQVNSIFSRFNVNQKTFFTEQMRSSVSKTSPAERTENLNLTLNEENFVEYSQLFPFFSHYLCTGRSSWPAASATRHRLVWGCAFVFVFVFSCLCWVFCSLGKRNDPTISPIGERGGELSAVHVLPGSFLPVRGRDVIKENENFGTMSDIEFFMRRQWEKLPTFTPTTTLPRYYA